MKNTLIKSNIYMYIYIHFNNSKQHNKNKESTRSRVVASADGGIGIGPAQSPQAPGKLLGHPASMAKKIHVNTY